MLAVGEVAETVIHVIDYGFANLTLILLLHNLVKCSCYTTRLHMENKLEGREASEQDRRMVIIDNL